MNTGSDVSEKVKKGVRVYLMKRRESSEDPEFYRKPIGFYRKQIPFYRKVIYFIGK